MQEGPGSPLGKQARSTSLPRRNHLQTPDIASAKQQHARITSVSLSLCIVADLETDNISPRVFQVSWASCVRPRPGPRLARSGSPTGMLR